jgi:putative FmdB family regulatory protein
MPIYEFRCPSCEHQFELLYKDYPDIKTAVFCPQCACRAEKQPSTSSFILKGRGFHKNDYPGR